MESKDIDCSVFPGSNLSMRPLSNLQSTIGSNSAAALSGIFFVFSACSVTFFIISALAGSYEAALSMYF